MIGEIVWRLDIAQIEVMSDAQLRIRSRS